MEKALFDAVVQHALKFKTVFNIDHFLFKEQLDLVKDPSRFLTAVCSVRAGKTTACAADLIDTCIKMPGTKNLYITLARSSAKRIIWPDLLKINAEYHLEGASNGTDLSIQFPNGSVIYCLGANTEVEMDKIRGLSDVALVYIDESQLFRSHIKELINDIIVKRLYDRNGRCRLIGTPGPIPAGYFYDASLSSQWSHHSWTLHSNPWIEKKSGLTVEQLIDQDCKRRGVQINDPSIQRECFAKWVLDASALLLEYHADRNDYESLPAGLYTYILGMDFGFEDADAFCVLGWHEQSPNTYLIEEFIAEKQTYDQMVQNFDKLYRSYPFSRVVADPGGGGKKLIESLKERYPIPFEVADKQGKIANYGLLNNALRTARFFAKQDSRFAQDCNLLEKDYDKSTPEKTVVKGHSDAVDAVLYAFKESPAYGYTPPIVKPREGTKEYDDEFADIMFQYTLEKLKKEKENKDAQGLNWELNADGTPPWNQW